MLRNKEIESAIRMEGLSAPVTVTWEVTNRCNLRCAHCLSGSSPEADTSTDLSLAEARWVVEFEPEGARAVEPLMGWTSSADTKGQVRLFFDGEAAAVAYAEKHGYMYSLEAPRERKPRPKAYADNFKSGRLGRWTH